MGKLLKLLKTRTKRNHNPKLAFCSGCKGILILRLQNQTHCLLNVTLSISIPLIAHACLQEDRDAHVYHSTLSNTGLSYIRLKLTSPTYIGNRSSTKKNEIQTKPLPPKNQNGIPTHPPNHQTTKQ